MSFPLLRSAAFDHAGRFESCIHDIDLSLKYGYPRYFTGLLKVIENISSGNSGIRSTNGRATLASR